MMLVIDRIRQKCERTRL